MPLATVARGGGDIMSNETLRVTHEVQQAAVGAARRAEAQREKPAPEPADAQASASVEPTDASINEAAKRIDAYLRSAGRSLEFRVDETSGRTVVSVRDVNTGELIRQIPGEEVLRIAEMAHEQTIVLLNARV